MPERVLFLTTKVTICEETRCLYRLSMGLGVRGHTVLCCLPQNGGSAAEALGGRCWWGFGRRFGALLFRDRWMREAAEFQPTVIHAFGQGVLAAAGELASALAVPLMVTLFETPGRSSVSQLRRRPPAGLLTTHEELVDEVRARLPSFSGPLRVVVPGVKVPPEEAGRAEGERPFVIGTVSELRRGCGLEVLLQAVGRLREQGQSCELVLMGEGPAEEELRILARRSGIRSQTSFLPPLAEPVPVMTGMDVAVVLSRQRLRVLSIVEAQAAAAAVVASSAPGVERLVEDGVTGRVVREPTPEVLAGTFRELLLGDDLRRSMAEEARTNVRRLASLEQMVEAVEAAYADVTSAAGGVSR